MTDEASPSLWRRGARLLSMVLLGALAVVTLARLLGFEAGVFAVVVAFTPWFALLAVVTLLIAWGGRARVVAAGTGVMFALHAWWLAPLFVGGHAGEPELTVVTLNASYGEADPVEIVHLVENYGVDILTIQELTPDLVSALREAGLDRSLPFSVTQPETNHAGIGLWSRTPIARPMVLDDLSSWAILGDIETARGPVAVFAVHPLPPGVRGHARWSEDLAALTQLIDTMPGPVLVAGDFNTTRDHGAFRHLERLGFIDESDQAAAGIHFTFPEGFGFPAVVAIDHVLTRDTPWAAVRVRTVAVTGSDHRALVVDYAAQ